MSHRAKVASGCCSSVTRGTQMHTPPSITANTTTTGTTTTTTTTTFYHDAEETERVAIRGGMRGGGHGEEQQNGAGATNRLRMRHAFNVQQQHASDEPTPASRAHEGAGSSAAAGSTCRGRPAIAQRTATPTAAESCCVISKRERAAAAATRSPQALATSTTGGAEWARE